MATSWRVASMVERQCPHAQSPEAAVLGFLRAQSRRREHEDMTWMASRRLGNGGQRQPGRPASSTSNLSTHALVAPRRLHPVPSPTASFNPGPSTPRPSPFPIPRRFFSI